MQVYYGGVHFDSIELEGDTQLPEGTPVEVHLRPLSDPTSGATTLQAHLRAVGLLALEPQTADTDSADNFVPVVAQGEPLSVQILRERR